MTGKIEQRLAELGVVVPDAAPAAAAYVPYRMSGSLLFTSGQLPLVGGKLEETGLVGGEIDLERAKQVARTCAINVLAQVKAATGGDFEKVASVIKLTVFVASAPGFTDQHLVANGASELVSAVFGERGQHARSAVGMASLPMNAPVEVEAILELR